MRMVCVGVLVAAAGMLAATPAVDKTKPVKVFEGFTNNVQAICLSPDGKQVIGTGDDKTLRTFDMETAKEALNVKLEWQPRHVAATVDGKWIFFGGARGVLQGVDAKTGRKGQVLAADSNAVGFSPDGSTAGAWIAEQRLRGVALMETAHGRVLQKLTMEDEPSSIAVSKGGAVVAAGTFGKGGENIYVFDGKTSKLIAKLEHDKGQVTVAITPEGNIIASAGATPTNKGVRLWDVKSKSARKVEGAESNNPRLAFSTDGKFLAASTTDGVAIVDVGKGAVVARTAKGVSANDLAFTLDGKGILVAAGGQNRVELWQW